MTTAAIYARLSDDKRADGSSVDAQIRACRAYIQQRGWTLGEIYRDDSISATTGAERPAFERMLSDAPPVVVAFKQDRLSRDLMDTLRIKAAGITGHMCDGAKLDFSTADSEMMTMFRTAMDQAEGRKKAERQRLASRRDAEAGKWHYSQPVMGNDRASGALVEDEAQAIREAAEDLLEERVTFWGIANRWNEAGFRSRGREGNFWEAGTVRNFFKSSRLIGVRTYQGTEHTMKGWEPVLEREVWEQVQSYIEERKTGKRGVQGSRHNPHLLTGIATCGECGSGLNVAYRGGKGDYRSYKCRTPGHVSRKGSDLERFVVEKFLYLLAHAGAEDLVNPEAKKASAVRSAKVREVREHEAWLEEAAEEGLSPKVIGAKERAHAARLAELDAELLEAVRESSFADLLGEIAGEGLWQRWEAMPMSRRREVVSALFSEIAVLKAPQGSRFSPDYVRLRATPLMLSLVELNSEAQELSLDQVEALLASAG